ncbi:MAG: hypothetical protein ACKVPJ_13425 [Chitinophagales bacterium]
MLSVETEAVKPVDSELYNADIRQWASTELYEKSISSIVTDTGKTRESIGIGFRKNGEEIERIGIGFERTGIYIETGAHTGAGGQKGSTWYLHGLKRSTNPLSFGKMGTGNRPAKPWLNPTLDEATPKLAQLVTNYYADATIKTIKITNV